MQVRTLQVFGAATLLVAAGGAVVYDVSAPGGEAVANELAQLPALKQAPIIPGCGTGGMTYGYRLDRTNLHALKADLERAGWHLVTNQHRFGEYERFFGWWRKVKCKVSIPSETTEASQIAVYIASER